MTSSLTIRHEPEPHPDTSVPDTHQDTFSATFLGFWTYLMTDCLIFATLFISYAVLHQNTFGGPSTHDIYDLKTTFAETMALLFSSLTCGLAVLSAVKGKKSHVVGWLFATFLFGATFLSLELHEFAGLIEEGHSWTVSAFLSSFFALVGTHGLHITFGLTWMAVMIAQVHFNGLNIDTFRRLVVFNLFWHFLDVIWIFIFSFVYLMGVA